MKRRHAIRLIMGRALQETAGALQSDPEGLCTGCGAPIPPEDGSGVCRRCSMPEGGPQAPQRCEGCQAAVHQMERMMLRESFTFPSLLLQKTWRYVYNTVTGDQR